VILAKKEANLHQVACLRLFESTHKNAVAENVGNHPNSFFSSAVAFEKATIKANAQKEKNAVNTQVAPAADPVADAGDNNTEMAGP